MASEEWIVRILFFISQVRIQIAVRKYLDPANLFTDGSDQIGYSVSRMKWRFVFAHALLHLFSLLCNYTASIVKRLRVLQNAHMRILS